MNFVNLIDSPGHVDFTGEVEAALRVSDGALLVVDVVEGVCVQTVTVLRAALENAVRPVLVLNKIDRLFGELRLDPMEAYQRIVNVLEQVNVIMGVREVEQMMAAATVAETEQEHNEEWKFEDALGVSGRETVSGFFSPEQGNVVFASAIDGWAFRLIDFAKIFAEKFGISEKVLNKTLWGDFYFQSKTKKIVRKKFTDLKSKAKPMFVQFVLQNMHTIYEKVINTENDIQLAIEQRKKLVEKLQLKVNSRELRHRDAGVALRAIMNAWLPASVCLMNTIIEKLPSAKDAQADDHRLQILWPNVDRMVLEEENVGKNSSETLLQALHQQHEAVKSTTVGKSAPLIAYVSKMFENSNKKGGQGQMNIRTPKTKEELEIIRQEATKATASVNEDNGSSMRMVAMARVLSGTISVGDTVFVYSPKYEVRENGSYDRSHVAKATVTNLFLLMGRGMNALQSASAGAVIGIAGLDEVVMKTATLSSEPPGQCFPVGPKPSSTLGIDKDALVKVAVEPHLPNFAPKLREGLRRLNQADPAVETYISAKGEHVLAASGELHLERCLKDLREIFAKGVRIHVSKPIVSFRETVYGGVSPYVETPFAKADNELISGKKGRMEAENSAEERGKDESTIPSAVDRTVWSVRVESKRIGKDESVVLNKSFVEWGRLVRVGNENLSLTLAAFPLPHQLASVLEDVAPALRKFETKKQIDVQLIDETRQKIEKALDEHAEDTSTKKKSCKSIKDYWYEQLFPRIWSAGPKQFGSNLLVGPDQGFSRSTLLEKVFGKSSVVGSVQDSRLRREAEKAIISGFQLGTRGGPLCEEPMHGIAFVIHEFKEPSLGEEAVADGTLDGEDTTTLGKIQDIGVANMSGIMISSMKDAVRLALMHGNPRLMEGFLHVDIATPGDALGNAYTVLGQRRGRVLNEEIKEGVNVFGIEAYLPVQDSFGFTDSLRKQTSGFAVPQMVFSHWELIEQDPFWYPQTVEELEDLGASDTTAETNNLARKLMNSVRRRKGLRVEEKLVENAEKQRTLSRKK